LGFDVSGERHGDGVAREGDGMKFMSLVYGSQRDYDGMVGKGDGTPTWSPEDFAAMGTFMESFPKDLAASGELVETRGLAGPIPARRVQQRNGVPVVTDGPYAETTEVLAGYWIVECDSFDRATAIAARLANCPGPAGVADAAYADVRPILESRDALDS
jgi:hypothetical protein